MDVCRIIKADISVKVGEIITTSKFERKYSEGRAKAESLLEDIRKRECLEMLGRKNSLFVFPNDDKLEERIFHWASTYAPNPTSSCQVYLLDLEVDKVEWHDSSFYEDLFFLLNGRKYGMRDRTSTADSLCSKYWSELSDISEITTEGLIEKGIISKITPYVVTHNKIEKIGD